jgi:hypothetical protein
VISQSTFDEAVADNMSSFGQCRADAVADAVAEFRASGVDLSNIVVSHAEPGAPAADGEAAPPSHPVLAAVDALRALTAAPGGCAADGDALTHTAAALATLTRECSAAPPPAVTPGGGGSGSGGVGGSGVTSAAPGSNPRAVAGTNGGVVAVCAAMSQLSGAPGSGAAHYATLASAADALRVLVLGQDGNRGQVAGETLRVLLAGMTRGAGAPSAAGVVGSAAATGADGEELAALVALHRCVAGAGSAGGR